NAGLLKADVAVISDTNQFARGLPAITYGLRGLCYEEVFVTGPDHDLHSGMYGGSVPNPANVLCQILASLHDKDGRVTIPGFYDKVIPLAAEERAEWARLPAEESKLAAAVGIPFGNGETGYTTLERRWARPTLDVNGITTGYQGPGAKTVIPSKASAKVSMRLVPGQDPVEVRKLFEQVVRDRAPRNVKVEFANYGVAEPSLTPHDSPAVALAREALELGFGVKPTLMREGGTIPVVALLKRTLGIDTLLVGFGLPDDRVHSPNEKFDLDALHKGTRTAAALYAKLAGLKPAAATPAP
ncbi:MAG TPA: M20/M25/M40 family metallo-hydrolase, partial [Humisphaera sp.]